MREQLVNRGDLVATIEAAIAALVRAYPPDEFGKLIERPRHQQILPHAVFVRGQCQDLDVDKTLLNGLDSLIGLLQKIGSTSDVEQQHRDAIELSTTTFGASHVEVARRLSDFADFLRDEGQHGDAEQYYRNAHEICFGAVSETDPILIRIMVNLGDLLRTMGRLSEAEPLLVDAFERHKSHRKSDSSPVDALDFINTANGLGNFVREKGDPSKAAAMFRDAIAVGDRELGSKHPCLGTCWNNLAFTLTEMRRYDEAETAFELSLRIKEDYQVGVGPFHLSYAITLSNLAKVWHAKGRSKDAETLHPDLPFKSKLRLEAENGVLRHQLDVLRRIRCTTCEGAGRMR